MHMHWAPACTCIGHGQLSSRWSWGAERSDVASGRRGGGGGGGAVVGGGGRGGRRQAPSTSSRRPCACQASPSLCRPRPAGLQRGSADGSGTRAVPPQRGGARLHGAVHTQCMRGACAVPALGTVVATAAHGAHVHRTCTCNMHMHVHMHMHMHVHMHMQVHMHSSTRRAARAAGARARGVAQRHGEATVLGGLGRQKVSVAAAHVRRARPRRLPLQRAEAHLVALESTHLGQRGRARHGVRSGGAARHEARLRGVASRGCVGAWMRARVDVCVHAWMCACASEAHLPRAPDHRGELRRLVARRSARVDHLGGVWCDSAHHTMHCTVKYILGASCCTT